MSEVYIFLNFDKVNATNFSSIGGRGHTSRIGQVALLAQTRVRTFTLKAVNLQKNMLPFALLFPVSGPNGGYLPHWILFISVVSIFNSLQNYLIKDLSLTRRVYSRAPRTEVTSLSARTFGTWTFLTSIVRLYGAYNLVGNEQWYNVSMWTFAIAGFHFFSEWLVYGNCQLDKGLAGPLVVASSSLIWMYKQKLYYVGI